MGSTGGIVVTPVPTPPVGGTGPSVAIPLPYTWLSLPRYARILGVNPVHFQGAVGQSIWPLNNNRCNDVWPRHSWQSADQVSREELSLVIKQAEDEVSRFLGYPLAPTWVTNENHQYPQFYRSEYYGIAGRNIRGDRKAVKARWGKLIRPGTRAVTLVASPTVAGGDLTYTDEDGDGFYETATLTATTTATDACTLKVYFSGTSANPDWEIRPAKSKSISGGTVTITMDSWLFIDPDTQGAYPDVDDFGAIDITNAANYVSTVDIYYEYTDNTDTSAQFFWEPTSNSVLCTSCSGTGCYMCTFTTQNGCFLVRDVEAGFAVPTPATYDSDTGQWTKSAFSVCRDPDQVKLWYLAGNMSDRYLSGDSCDPLDDLFAMAIAWIATARLERPFCQCGNVTALAESLRVDLTHQGDTAHLFDFNMLDAPFGTKRGEIMAFIRLSQLGLRKFSVGVI